MKPIVQPGMLASVDEVQAARRDPASASSTRGADRYRGENETIDPVAGHIPAAISAPFAENLGRDGLFLTPEALRGRFERLLEGISPEMAIFYCGSGVTAGHNVLAMARCGLGMPRLCLGLLEERVDHRSRPSGGEVNSNK